MELAVKVVAAILGFIAGVLIYPWFNAYVISLIALLGAIAVGVIVYVLVCRLAAGINTTRI